MAETHFPGAAGAKRLYGFIEATRAGVFEVKPAQQSPYRCVFGQAGDVAQGVDRACVGTTKHHHHTGRCFEENRLVVEQRVGPGHRFVEKERAAGVFKIVDAWNLARHPYPGDHLRRIGGDDQFGAKAAEAFVLQKINAQAASAWLAVGAGEFHLRDAWMQEERGFLRDAEHLFESADMIGVTVAEDDCVGRAQVDAEAVGVVQQRETLSGVEEHAVRSRVDPPGQTVLAEDTHAARGIFDEERDRGHWMGCFAA